MTRLSWARPAPQSEPPSPPASRPAVRTLLAIFVLLSALFSVVTPPFEAPDEIWHFAFVQHLVTQRALPLAEPDTQALWRQQGTQAPGYYAGAALLSAWIDQSDFPEIFARANPHRAIGRPDAAINRNYLIHHPQAERFPWRRSILALHVARLFSVFLGALTVYAVYRSLRLLLSPEDALLGAAFVGFLPQFVFISGSVSNDNAVNATAALVLWQLMEIMVDRRRSRPTQSPIAKADLLKLGVFLGLALLSKLSGLGLVGVAGLAILWLAWRSRSLRLIFDAALWTAVPVILVAGWWYVRNWRLYGDPMAWEMWEANILLRVIPAGPAQILSELEGLERSFWGLFGWLNLLYPAWVYATLRVVVIIVAGGLLFHGVRSALRARRYESLAPHAILLLWFLVLAISWLRFMRVAPAAQGRYFFAALPVLGLLWALGWTGWGRFGRRIGWGVTCALGLLTAATPFALIRPAYTPPPMPIPSDSPTQPLAAFGAGGMQIELVEAAASAAVVMPGDEVQMDVAFRSRAALADDWSLFIHLVDGTGLIVAQLDTMPGGGLRPTSGWREGGILSDSYTISIPETVYTPNRARWQLGFYNHRSGERLLRAGGGQSYAFGDVAIAPYGDDRDIPDCPLPSARGCGQQRAIPVYVRFADNITLTGYRFNSRLPVPGQEMTVTLYWTATGPVAESYTVFAHLLTDSFEMFGGADLEPTPPTEGWAAGEFLETVHTFTVQPDAPPGLYQIEIGLYTRPGFRRLRVLDKVNAAEEDRLLLGPLRIEPPP